MNPELITHYFPEITPRQREQFGQLGPLYTHWNNQINVISRKDIDSLYLHHVLHSLAIAKVVSLLPGEKVLDVGTGGGFPGIPLAILFPETKFHLVDSIGKKIKVVTEIASAIGLQNVTATHARAEQIRGPFDFIVSRAVTRLADFYPWVKGKVSRRGENSIQNGILYLKGGDLADEIGESGLDARLIPIPGFFREEFFETKYVMYIPQ